MRERSSTLGQLTLTSTATTGLPTPLSIEAALANPSTLRPQMLTTTVAPASRRRGNSVSNHDSRPGPLSPTLLTMLAPDSVTRGAGLPGHGSADSDFTTWAPSAPRGP